jgi:hypothetical protein
MPDVSGRTGSNQTLKDVWFSTQMGPKPTQALVLEYAEKAREGWAVHHSISD